ncbi:MAG: hypothetical protein Q7R76_04540 [Candidatus Woesearchaeota archaeon]|nr:hypothetical protein [Candidatus Woesearchaeota archaeon]
MATEAKNLRDVSSVLRTSFQAIKRDIAGLTERLEANQQRNEMVAHQTQQLEHTLGLLAGDFITTDKLNVVKIQLGDLKDELKRADAAEKAVRDLRSIAATKVTTEKALADLRSEFEAKHARWRSNVKSLTKTVDSAFEKINKNMAVVQTANNRDIDGRMAGFRKEFDTRLYQASAEGTMRTEKTNAALAAHQKRTQEEFQRVARKSHVHELVRDLNNEFNTLKERLATMGDETGELRNDVESLDHRTRDFESIQKQFSTMHSNFESLKSRMVADIHDVQDDIHRLGKKVKENIPPKELRSAARLLHLKSKTPPLVKTSNVLISISFALVVFAGILFFALAKTNGFLVTWTVGLAVGVFVIGLLFRTVHAIKN